MTTILGAGGAIGSKLAKILTAKGAPLRLASRSPKPAAGAEAVAADLADLEQTIRAVAGSEIVHLLVGLRYNLADWQALWPKIMANTIEACKRANARLVFLDNVYMYGKVEGPMTENTPYAPCSRKGEIRARIATALMDEVKAGGLTAMIARSADFYGPDTPTGLPNILVFDAFAKNKKAGWMGDPDAPHSFTFTPDAANAIAMLAENDSAWNQIWHLPTEPDPPTGRELIGMAAREFGVAPKFRTLSRPMLLMAGLFKPEIRELREMLYQNEFPYLFDSTKFSTAFGFAGTPYPEGIRISVESYSRT